MKNEPVEAIRAKLDHLRVRRVHASLYPEVHRLAKQIGSGNVSRGLTLAVLEAAERREQEQS